MKNKLLELKHVVRHIVTCKGRALAWRPIMYSEDSITPLHVSYRGLILSRHYMLMLRWGAAGTQG